MPRLKIWRLLALAAVPLAILGIHGRFRQTDIWHSTATFGSNINRTAQQLEARITTIEWIEQEIGRAAASPAAVRDGALTVLMGNDPTDGAASAMDRARQARTELARMPAAQPNDVRVVLLVAQMPSYSHGRQSQWSFGSAPLSNDVWNPCVMATTDESPTESATGRLLPQITGQCALAAAYGEPGPAIRDWIGRLSLRSGQPAFARARWGERDEHDRLLLNTSEQVSMRSFGGFSAIELDLLNCRSGDLHSCRELLRTPFVSSLRGDFAWWLIQRDSTAFGRFWRAGGSVEAAARAELGAPLDQLMGEFSRERIAVAQAGPALPKHSWMTLFWIIGPLALAASRARRQTVSS